VFVVAVALMPTAHSNRGRKTPSRLKELKERLAAKCRSGTCPKTKTSTGLLITGGYGGDSLDSLKSVEVYVPSTGQNCQIADLPAGRWGHTMENRFLCGGGVYNIGPPPDTSPDTDVRTSCLTLTDAGWEVTTSLLDVRWHHTSWDSPAGVILMGGPGSRKTTEKILQDGSTTASFPLKYST